MKTHLCLSIFTTLLITLATAQHASAFCGMYVSNKSDETLLNDATQVVLFREGIHTALTMRNSYKGPVEDFAMLVPVPQVLDKNHVHTVIPKHLDELTSFTVPRLVKYEQTFSCINYSSDDLFAVIKDGVGSTKRSSKVKVLEEYDVAEYEIKILEAKDSSGLLTWLKDHKYKVPEGGEELLQGYINTGMYFFVAKINADKVTFEDGEAVLTPLKFTYTSEEFSLPVRLGLLNANGPQDLLIHIISDEGRFESSNYRTGIIPTNLIVDKKVEKGFASFYESLFSHVLKSQEAQLITEFVGQAFWQKCDPCVSDRGTVSKDVLLALAYEGDVSKYVLDSLEIQEFRGNGNTDSYNSMNRTLIRYLKGKTRSCFDTNTFKMKPEQEHEGHVGCAAKRTKKTGNTWEVTCDEGKFSGEFDKKDILTLQGCLETQTREFLKRGLAKTSTLSFTLHYNMARKALSSMRHNTKSYVVTRLRGRFNTKSSKEDIVFTKADPLLGGYGTPDKKGKMTSFYSLGENQENRFQARYIILNYLNKKKAEKTCENPEKMYYHWGSPSTSGSTTNTLSQKKKPKTFGKKHLKKLIKNEKDAKLNL